MGAKTPVVSGWVRARRAADGCLVDFDNLVDMFGAEELLVGSGGFLRAVKFLRKRAIENVVHERGFAGAGNARYDGEQAKRDGNIHVFQVVGGGAHESG